MSPREEAFHELLARSRRGRLKLYIGFAAGVGKTYRMLEEAHELKARGEDVVLALVETHGREDTARLLPGLEIVPRRLVSYRGVVVEEMDLDAVLARKPAVAVVDELAHTNAPGSRHKKRWEDVVELLDEGIHVIGALNVQHLESLNDLVERLTRVKVRETVPDRFLARADQVVNLDLAVEDLLERLRAGKVYPPEAIDRALRNFFRSANLTTLRELALFQVAESLERGEAGTRGGEAAQRVMVCMSSRPPRAARLLRIGARIAGRLNTDWFVVYVQAPKEPPAGIAGEARRRLGENIRLARDLGAQVVQLRAEDPVPALLDFARSHGVGHLVVGRSQASRLRTLSGRSVFHRLLQQATDIDVHVAALDEQKRS